MATYNGLDLLDFFRDERPWGQFWRLLDQLGRDSRYRAAQLDDPDVAELLAGEDGGDKWSPMPADFTLMHELVAEVRDLMADAVVILGRGLPSNGKREFVDRFPRPDTELARALENREKTKVEKYDEDLLDFAEKAKARWRAQQEREAVASPSPTEEGHPHA